MSYPVAQYQAAQQCAKEMGRLCFDGDFKGFEETFAAYCQTYFQRDPFGRLPLKKAMEGFAPLSFRTLTTQRSEYEDGTRARWKAWLAVLPLDMQLSFLQYNAERYNIDLADLTQVKWHQQHDIDEASFPGKIYRKNALWDRDKELDWGDKRAQLVKSAQLFASSLMHWKSWEKLDDWMTQGKLDPCAPISDFYVHYTTSTGRGASMISAKSPLQFWHMGVFTGAVEPEFWDVLARHGGPAHPLDGASSPIQDFSCALDWVQERSNLQPEAVQAVIETGTQWNRMILDHASAASLASKRVNRL